MQIKELREKLELWDGEMEIDVMDEHRNLYDIERIEYSPREECLVIKIKL